MTLSDLQILMHQLGPATPEIISIIQDDIDSWMVEFDEAVSLQIAWDERSMRVLMKCGLGQPYESTREEIYRLLLNANLLLTGVADVKLALSDVDDDVMLIGEYALQEPTLEALQQRLSDYLSFAEKFSTMIAKTFSDDGSEDFSSIGRMRHVQT